jgi:hypothetical protein
MTEQQITEQKKFDAELETYIGIGIIALWFFFAVFFTIKSDGASLMSAVKDGDVTNVMYLLDNGADVNAKTKSGVTALITAAAKSHTEIVKLLLDNGADVNAKDKEGRTALMWAGDHTEIVKLFKQHSAKARELEAKRKAEKYEKKIVVTAKERKNQQRKQSIKPKKTGQDGNFIAYNNGIVYDTKTGLEWFAGPDKDTTWDEAKEWVEHLTLAGSGWRMPIIDEIKSLYKKGAGKRNMTPLFKTTGWVWSGETKGFSTAWGFFFSNGNDIWYGRNNASSSRVFAVRFRK